MTGGLQMNKPPLGIDLFCGLSGWAEGLVSEGFEVVGFDIEDMCANFGMQRPAGVQLVLQDVLTLHGKQFRNADLIVASPPCQAYSWRAMPWKAAKAAPPPSNALFDACFRIQREACEAAGHHIPMVVENVRGAQKWVGRSRWNFGSFHFWGDVPALMPMTMGREVMKAGDTHRSNGATNFHGFKSSGLNWSDRTRKGQDFTRVAGNQAMGVKHHGSGAVWFDTGPSAMSSKSSKRKYASAMIAKIPFAISSHIARTFKPVRAAA